MPLSLFAKQRRAVLHSQRQPHPSQKEESDGKRFFLEEKLVLLSKSVLPAQKRTGWRDVLLRQSAVSWSRMLRWLEPWLHLHRVLSPRPVRLVGTVLQSSRKSGGRHQCRTECEYESSSNDRVMAPRNHIPDTSGHLADPPPGASASARNGRVAEWTLLPLGPLRTARESFPSSRSSTSRTSL